MKIAVSFVLFIAIVIMTYLCYDSIMGSVDFGKQVDYREKFIKQRLVDIREVQKSYFKEKKVYASSFDSIKDFIKNGTTLGFNKKGELTEAQLKSGLTDIKAAQIIKSGKIKNIKKAGLIDSLTGKPIEFVRDSVVQKVSDVLSFTKRNDFNVDSIEYVPFGNGAKFEIAVGEIKTASEYTVKVFEVKTSYSSYLGDLEKIYVGQKIADQENKPGDQYAGLRVGSIKTINNAAGNWED